MKFYGGILGFQEIWRGSKDGKVLSWVNMKVPEGKRLPGVHALRPDARPEIPRHPAPHLPRSPRYRKI
jgi:hypothetical protein